MADVLSMLRAKPWRRRDHCLVFSTFAETLAHLVAPSGDGRGEAAPPRILILP